MSVLTPRRSRSALMRFPSWPELDSLQERIDRMFGRALPTGIEEPMEWLPAVDLKEADDELVLTAEFPGMTEKDIEIDVEQNVLTLRGEKKVEKEEKGNGGRWYLLERSYGSFQRSFTLPGTVDASGIEAEFSNGLLTVHLPKRTESAARRIGISSK